MKYYYFHLLTCPELSWVAVDEDDQVVGYVLANVYGFRPLYSRAGTTTILNVERSLQLPLGEIIGVLV